MQQMDERYLEICRDRPFSTECLIDKVFFNRNSFPVLQAQPAADPQNAFAFFKEP
jgi:hypothetical protein